MDVPGLVNVFACWSDIRLVRYAGAKPFTFTLLFSHLTDAFIQLQTKKVTKTIS